MLKELDAAMTVFAGKPTPEKKKELEKQVRSPLKRKRSTRKIVFVFDQVVEYRIRRNKNISEP